MSRSYGVDHIYMGFADTYNCMEAREELANRTEQNRG
jgi:hypothetical protein